MVNEQSVTQAFFFFFNDTATTEIYTLSLHDALPICREAGSRRNTARPPGPRSEGARRAGGRERFRTTGSEPGRGKRRSEEQRLNSSHDQISYAVFCLKKKKTRRVPPRTDSLTSQHAR